MTEIGNYLHIEPDEPLNLPTGIYTYRFKYLIDRAVWFYDNFDELYWDITAKTLKNVVGSANAVVFLPSNKSFVAQNAVASTRGGLDNRRVTINTLASNSLGFADTEALGVGEDIHLFLTMEKGTLLPPDFSKNTSGLFTTTAPACLPFSPCWQSCSPIGYRLSRFAATKTKPTPTSKKRRLSSVC